MARKRRLNGFQAGELNLTAMIDVAFQLLAFFIITTHPVDVLASLDVFRPAAVIPVDPQTIRPPPSFRVTVFPDGYAVNDNLMTFEKMAVRLGQLASLDGSQAVIIQCVNEAQHGQLVALLDTCAKAGLTNLSVVSSGGE